MRRRNDDLDLDTQVEVEMAEAAAREKRAAASAIEAEAEASRYAPACRLFAEVAAAVTKFAAEQQLRGEQSERMELRAVARDSVPAMTRAQLVGALIRIFGGKFYDGSYPEVKTDTLGSVYLPKNEDGLVDPASIHLANGDQPRHARFEEFRYALGTKGLTQHRGAPTGKTVLEVAERTAEMFGGKVILLQVGNVFTVSVGLPDGRACDFPPGIRPAGERPWLRGGSVVHVPAGGDRRCASSQSLAGVWAARNGA